MPQLAGARCGALALSIAALLAAAPAALASGGGGGTSSSACASITKMSGSVGYYKTNAAMHISYDMTSSRTCGATRWRMDFVNELTGNVDCSSSNWVLTGNSGATVDDDFAQFSTPYHVVLQITNQSGQVISSDSVDVTTLGPKAGVPGV
jgi:hypothetical protein